MSGSCCASCFEITKVAQKVALLSPVKVQFVFAGRRHQQPVPGGGAAERADRRAGGADRVAAPGLRVAADGDDAHPGRERLRQGRGNE